MACTACLVCLVITLSGCRKNALGIGSIFSEHITKLELSTFLGIYDQLSMCQLSMLQLSLYQLHRHHIKNKLIKWQVLLALFVWLVLLVAVAKMPWEEADLVANT
jgi:hypothetical protein